MPTALAAHGGGGVGAFSLPQLPSFHLGTRRPATFWCCEKVADRHFPLENVFELKTPGREPSTRDTRVKARLAPAFAPTGSPICNARIKSIVAEIPRNLRTKPGANRRDLIGIRAQRQQVRRGFTAHRVRGPIAPAIAENSIAAPISFRAGYFGRVLVAGDPVLAFLMMGSGM